MKLDHSDPQFAPALADAIVALSYHLCGVPFDAVPPIGGVINGFSKLDPIYVETTERRDGPGDRERENYSSCADQLHAIMERVGVRERWVNRASLGFYKNSTPTITKLEPYHSKNNPIGSPASIWAPKDPAYRPPAGSLCLIWTTGGDAHALVVLGPGSDSRHIRTANYGAMGMNKALSPGATVADSPCTWNGSALLIGGAHKALHTVITPAALVPFITDQIHLLGAEVTDDLIQALGARWKDPSNA